MPKTRIPSPSRSESMRLTPRKHRSRSRLSVESLARSTSLRVTAMVHQNERRSRTSSSPSLIQSRLSVLSDNTQIEEPRRRSWWRKLDENTADIIDVLSSKKKSIDSDTRIDELMAVDVLSQQSRNYSTDIPESSGSDSIHTIVITRRELFTQKDHQKKRFDHIIGPRRLLSERFNRSSATSTTIEDKTINVNRKNLFNHRNPKRNKPSIPLALLNLSLDKTVANKTKEINVEIEAPAKNLFGNRIVKRKNMFENFDFAISESEMEIPEIQPKVFGFKMRREESHGHGLRDVSPSSSVTTDMEMDEWKLLPSSTMVEHQLLTEFKSPAKRPKMSRVSRVSGNSVEELQVDDKEGSYSHKEIIETCVSNLVQSNLGATNVVHGNNFNGSQEEPKSVSKKVTKIVQENVTEEQQKHYETELNEVEQQETKKVAGVSDSVNVVENNLVEKLLEDDADVNRSKGSEPSNKMSETSRASTIVQNFVQEPQENNIYYVEKECSNPNKSKDQNVIDRSRSIIDRERNKSEDNIEIQKEVNPIIVKQNKQKNCEEKIRLMDESVQQDKKNREGLTDIDDHDKNVDVKRPEEEDVQKMYQLNEYKKVDNKVETHNSDNHSNEVIDVKISEADNEVIIIQSDEFTKENVKDRDEIEKGENQQARNESLDAKNNSYEIEDEFKEDIQDENNSDIETEDKKLETERSVGHSNEEVDVDRSKVEDKEHMSQSNRSIKQNEDIENRYEIETGENQEAKNERLDVQNSNNKIEEQDKQDENYSDIETENKTQETDENADHGNEDVDVDRSEAEDEEDMDQSNESIEQNEDVEVRDEMEKGENHEAINESLDSKNGNDKIENQFEDDIQDENDSDIETEDYESDDNGNEDIDRSEEKMYQSNQSIEQNEDVEENEEKEEEESQEMVYESEHESQNDEIENECEEELDDSQDLEKASSDDECDSEKINEPEAILRDMTNVKHSFMTQRRNTSIRKTKSITRNVTVEPSLAPVRDSIGILSDGTRNSSAEGSGWDSHRTTRKTLRQTFGKDFTLRKSLRTLVMEKSAKRQTQALNEKTADFSKFPQANSTEFPQGDWEVEESDHEMSRKMRQTTIEMYLEKIKMQNIEKAKEIEERVQKSYEEVIQRQPKDILNKIILQGSSKPIFTKKIEKTEQMKPKRKKNTFDEPFDLPKEFLEDLNYKPPKRFNPSNASWITKRLYNFLETKLEPRYKYKARVRAEKLVETIYEFTKVVRRHEVAPLAAVDDLKVEMARLDIVKTHFEFYTFFHEYMPREIRRKVNPDIVNRIPKPRSIFDAIIPENV